MNKTDKENEYKNAILIRFKDIKSAKNYFIKYNGQIHNTDMISLCNFDDPHSLKAELEKARELMGKVSFLSKCKGMPIREWEFRYDDCIDELEEFLKKGGE